MATKEEYAAFSAIVYNNARHPINRVNDLPPNWIPLPLTADNSITGFTAAAFRNTLTGEIVIAYKGTDSGNKVQMAQDFLFGNTAAFGSSTQLYQAALFYEQVKTLYGSNITITNGKMGSDSHVTRLSIRCA